jgi:hypothetical protein
VLKSTLIRQAKIQAQNNNLQLQYAKEVFQHQEELADLSDLLTSYLTRHSRTLTPFTYVSFTQPRQPSYISISLSNDNSEPSRNKELSIIAIKPGQPSENE